MSLSNFMACPEILNDIFLMTYAVNIQTNSCHADYISHSLQGRNTTNVGKTIEYSLNVFTEFAEFSDKNNCHCSKRARTCQPATSCVRDQDAITVPTRHM